MIYLGAFVVLWILRALVPAGVVALAGAIVVLVLKRARPALATRSWAILATLVVGVLGWQTWALRQRFAHPEFTMFRECIANPIPNAVRNLQPGSGAPLVFHTGAIIRFDAPEDVVRGIVTHSLRGSTAMAFLANVKSRNRRDTTTTARIAATDGVSYVKVDSSTFPAAMDSVFRGVRQRVVEAARRGVDIYVLAMTGDWGRFESVVTYDPATGRVDVHQFVLRASVLG